ncbi:PTS glucose transporter subunit IIA [Actinoalloteichus sp. AHMU CJ021]|uniref:PTS sugar transporter subunit IIA n=1 Tax=Actinoalloteichus sp. AHMU CJ021 TaxID=2072503 RepID=UPI000CA000A0|nr:PTS glucose transporter subunit IIA [Actinoalloteichus sp. AHMU CJ021]
MTLQVAAPLAGEVVPLSAVPDPVFAGAMVGPGVAIEPHPESTEVRAPIGGTVATLHPHAFVIAGDDGLGVLVHLGIDTVKLRGEGFTLRVVKGEKVRAGQPIVEWEPDAVREAGYSSTCPVIALDATAEDLSDLVVPRTVEIGAALFTWNR